MLGQQGPATTYMGSYPPNYAAASFSLPLTPPHSTAAPQGLPQSYGSYMPLQANMLPPGLNGLPSSPSSYHAFPKQFIGNGNIPILPPPIGGNNRRTYDYYPNGSNRTNSLNQNQTQNQGLVILPPPGTFYNDQTTQYQQQQLPVAATQFTQGSQVQPQPQPQPQPQEQTTSGVNGGVSHVLDYDIEIMAEYVVKTAYIAFGVDLNTASPYTFNSMATELTTGHDLFLKGLISVLNATRLPSTTIFQALDFLFKYLGKLPKGPESIGGTAVNVIYQNTMISFILANKFNDDKTFTNKSWSQATGMDLHVINEYEMVWLSTLEWRLFEDKFVYYTDFVQSFEKFVADKLEANLSANAMLSKVQTTTPFSTPAIAPSPRFSAVPVSSHGDYQTPIAPVASLNGSSSSSTAVASASVNNSVSNITNFFSSPCKYPTDDHTQQNGYYSNYQYGNLKGGIGLLMSSSPSLSSGVSKEQFPPSSSYDYYDSVASMPGQQQQQQQQQVPQRVSAQNLWNSSSRSNSKGSIYATFNQNNGSIYNCTDPSFESSKEYNYFTAYPRIY